jgi:hypothetical protein
MVVIRVPPREISACKQEYLGIPSAPKTACEVGNALLQYQSTDEAEGARIGLSY